MAPNSRCGVPLPLVIDLSKMPFMVVLDGKCLFLLLILSLVEKIDVFG